MGDYISRDSEAWMDEIALTFDEETGVWTEKKEPYCTVEFDTKEDFDFFNAAIKFYREYLEKAEKEDS